MKYPMITARTRSPGEVPKGREDWSPLSLGSNTSKGMKPRPWRHLQTVKAGETGIIWPVERCVDIPKG